MQYHPYKRYDEISRWPVREVGEKKFIELESLPLLPGRWTVSVVDITDLDVETVNGGCLAVVGSEGPYALVVLANGEKSQCRIGYISATVSFSSPRAEDLVDEQDV